RVALDTFSHRSGHAARQIRCFSHDFELPTIHPEHSAAGRQTAVQDERLWARCGEKSALAARRATFAYVGRGSGASWRTTGRAGWRHGPTRAYVGPVVGPVGRPRATRAADERHPTMRDFSRRI